MRASACLLFAIAMGGSSWSPGQPAAAIPASTASVRLDPAALPVGALVFVGENLLTTAARLTLPAGEHAIRIEAPGHQTAAGVLLLESEQPHLLRITTSPPAVPWEQNASWVSAAVGAGLLVATLIVDQTLEFEDPAAEAGVRMGLMGASAVSLVGSGTLQSHARETSPPLPTLSWSLEAVQR